MTTQQEELIPSTITQMEPELHKLSWKPLVLTNDKITELWKKLQEFPQIFDDFSKGDFNDFLGKLLNPANVFIDIGDGLGLAAGFGVRPGLDVVLHVVMFDRRLRGREDTFKDIMAYFFKALKLNRMTSIIADDCRTAINLALRIGFKEEGLMRQAMLRDGKLLDMHVLGILREEFDEQANPSAS